VIQVTASQHRSAFVLTRPQSSSFIGGSDVPSNIQINIQTCTAFSLIFIFLTTLSSQQTQTPAKLVPLSYDSIKAEATKQANPVKSSPESLARAKKWWTVDCAMYHGKDGAGKTEMAATRG
jgi:hypothetical protein